MKKRIIITIAAILFVLIAIGIFSNEKELPVDEPAEEDSIRVGMSFDGQRVLRHAAQRRPHREG